MITRYAIFEGSIHEGDTEAFRQAVNDNLVPLWTQFTGNTEVRVMFSEERDEGAPEYPLILGITYPDRETMEKALECNARYASKEATGKIVERYFTGKIHHHVTKMSEYPGGMLHL
ncbi:hypothetical protein [Leucothrix arctica]|uniref:Uncharacterized protein n=1 Tax=Leucothrix arctica TaxID=1481894 RepID=A0A317C5N5_9GAMM|nr:hypothetical protein [Leucothrix arctica]PWQ93975.1 hypothetical protein DKT75_20490 [Leucothrix arctica]